MKRSKEALIELSELIKICRLEPENVFFAKKSALDRAAREFSLNTKREVAEFIANKGLENPQVCRPTESRNFAGYKISAYKFNSGRKNGYIAFHASPKNPTGIYVKSFHQDDTNPSLGQFADIFKESFSKGDQND